MVGRFVFGRIAFSIGTLVLIGLLSRYVPSAAASPIGGPVATGVVVYVPTKLAPATAAAASLKLYPKVYYAPSLLVDRPNVWTVYYGATPECKGEHACNAFSISGSARRSLGPGRSVSLADGSIGKWVDSNCHQAYCSDATFTFDHRDETLTLAGPAISAAQFKIMAQSVMPAAGGR